MSKILFAFALCFAVCAGAAPSERLIHSFKKLQLSDKFWAEGASFGDFNRDGHSDIAAGPYWYEGPEFKTRHEYYPATRTFTLKEDGGTERQIPGFEGALGKNNAYSDNFFAFVHDFNSDGWPDILIMGFPGAESAWYANPRGEEGHWKKHVVLAVTDNESPTFADLTGDGKPEIVCNSGGYFGYAAPNWDRPEEPWPFVPVSPKGPWQRFSHGLGVGDVNGDSKADILDKDGWWEQPKSLEGNPEWKRHEFPFSPGAGGAQMLVYDVDGDGDNDVITALAAHGYGLAWYENVSSNGAITFKQHMIMNKEPHESRYGVAFSQLHALELMDMDGDGLKDVVTGKRFWAHGATGDPDPNAPAVLYWFKLVREPSIDFIPHLIDDNSGVGTQVVAGRVNGDTLPDVVVGNKKGTFVFLQETRKVSQEEWERSQPRRVDSKPAARATREGIVPKRADGQPLNLGFEEGTLKDWKAEGSAFSRPPVQGDTVAARRGDMKSNHDGNYWVGTYERGLGDAAQGTLTSVPFKVTQPYGSFLVAGGAWENTRVEIVRADNGEVLFKTSGFDPEEFKRSNNATETLRPVVVDLTAHQGRDVFIRVIDKQDGHWGHINFDDFKLHPAKPEFANAFAAKAPPIKDDAPPIDDVPFAGLAPEAAAKAATVPPGFELKLFAGEPDIHQPIAFALDDRGRLWVAEGHTYPHRAPEGQGRDRVLVFEDTDGDGKFNSRKVFMEGLNLVSGIEVGFGGVFIGAPPYLLFIADRNGDGEADGKPEVLLDGWGYQDTHETLNTFLWGPDGWLYGCQGIFTHSNVGRPGTPDAERTRLNAGIWRYHPIKKTFELFAEGTSNPWGVDFDERGQCVIEACVIPHLFHMVQGGRFTRQSSQHFNPHTYEDIKTVGDHVHYAGNRGPHAANNRSDAAGGGHAHAGLMVYLGDSWPDNFRGNYFMNNLHGQRINMDVPERKGSGITGRHGPDFVNFNDRWSQILNLLYDHDGSVYMIDWYDQNQCHHGNAPGHDRSNGRIFKLVYNQQPGTRIDLQKNSDLELARLQLHKNDWHVRHARRILQERAAAGPLDAEAVAFLEHVLRSNPDDTRRLRALWTLHVCGGLTEHVALEQLGSPHEFVRAWTLQLLTESRTASPAAVAQFEKLAADPSPVVRLYLASALQRIPIDQRWNVLFTLVAHAEDAADHNLPLMYWYAAEPGVGQDLGRALQLLAKTKIPKVREFISRRIASTDKVAAAR